ncbi:MAG TPA: hypothetical protein VG308_17760 [Stellaceae bacterium]|jgi:hypothetical protein|nr:hypothetical protein [Stellaceae bacterium]
MALQNNVTAAWLLLAALLTLSACGSEAERRYAAARHPAGTRQALHTGHWRGQVGMTEVDYAIDQVTPTTVSVRVSGTVLHQANRSYDRSSPQNYFYDRPRSCKRTADGRSFDCTRYTDMHIDNGLLCGVYVAPDQVYRPCLEPVP